MDDIRMIVCVSDQSATLFVNGREVKNYVVSTAAKGTGCAAESGKTPLGLMQVSEKFGDGMAPGTVFVDRVPNGAVWKPGDPAGPLILTRILWLDGMEPQNANTKDRYIYLHGTSKEGSLGTPTSQGCITFNNKDIIEVYDLMPVGSVVEVIP